MKISVLIVLCIFSQALTLSVTKEEKVLDLTLFEFADAFLENEYLLVEFYENRLAPEFSEAARIIAITDPSIKLAKVKIDVTEETFLADFYNVTAYPTLLFCKENGEFGIPELIKYDGVRT